MDLKVLSFLLLSGRYARLSAGVTGAAPFPFIRAGRVCPLSFVVVSLMQHYCAYL